MVAAERNRLMIRLPNQNFVDRPIDHVYVNHGKLDRTCTMCWAKLFAFEKGYFRSDRLKLFVVG
jgi:hypothetical protein